MRVWRRSCGPLQGWFRRDLAQRSNSHRQQWQARQALSAPASARGRYVATVLHVRLRRTFDAVNDFAQRFVAAFSKEKPRRSGVFLAAKALAGQRGHGWPLLVPAIRDDCKN